MRTKVKYLLFLFFYWYLYFVAARILFIIYQHNHLAGLSLKDILLSFYHGFKLDLSVTGYYLLLPLLFLTLTSFVNNKLLLNIIKVYGIILLIITGFLIVADMELYTYWGFRIDTTPLLYIKSKEAFTASLTAWQMIRLILILLIIWATSIYLFLIIFRSFKGKFKKSVFALGFILGFPILFILIRGGIGIAPLNTGSAYFHSNQFLNHTAINPIWNTFYSVSELKSSDEKFSFFEQKKAAEIVSEINKPAIPTKYVLKCKRPNIILIILESFTAKLIEPLGGMKYITPNLNHLVHEGILFNHFYANGDRTDKALVAILGAYPSLPKTQIIKYPSKSDKLDYIPKTLKEYGYKTAFFYGSSVEFANYNSILISARFDKITSIENFEASIPRTKWGVWDQVTFDRMLSEIPAKTNEKFFYTMLTLSSHEPFTIPGKPLMQGNTDDIKFENSINYTDQCIGNFIEKAKRSKWWDSTLIIFVADHGSIMPGNSEVQDPVKYHIPMIWVGGALNIRDTVISTYGSQQDIARTLLSQLNLVTNGFPFSHNIISNCTYPFAFFTFNDGFGTLTDRYNLVYDNTAGRFIIMLGKPDEFDFNAGKAYLQILNDDFLKK